MMSDYDFEKYPFTNEEEKKDSTDNMAQPAEQQYNAEEPKPEQPKVGQPAYVNPYADRTSYQSPVSEQTPYADPYRTVNTPSNTPPKSTTPSQNSADLDDGFYHHSYRSTTDNARTGYTQPSVTRVNQANQWQSASGSQPYSHQQKRSGGLSKGGVAILLVVCVLLSGLAGFGGSILASKLNASNYEAASDGSTMVVHKVNTENASVDADKVVDKSTEEITNEVADSVVEITTEIMQTNSFYGQYISKGAGSGVIISADGYIVTNNHVIDGASKISVTTRGGESYDATLVGNDSKVDIALLKIDAKDLPVAILGDSSELSVGSKAVIIGNPLGTLGGSVTEGIISALDRAIEIDGKTMHLMQTDAAVNPGNSGGGMFDGQGTLAGIVVAKSSSEGVDNIGFVIPINDVISVIDDLKDYGYVRGRADTGMTFIDLTNSMYAWYYYGTNESGVYINSVENGSNAAQAGFAKGDRIVSIDGTEIKSTDDINLIISEKSAGDTVTFEVDRNGNTVSIKLDLQEDVPDTNTDRNSSSDNGSGSGNESPYGQNPFRGLW